MNKPLSPRAQKMLSISVQQIAKKRSHSRLLPEHILLAILNDTTSVAYEILVNLKVNMLMLQLAVEQSFPEQQSEEVKGIIPPHRRFSSLLDVAEIESRTMRANYVGTEHLLIAIISEPGSVASRFFSAIPLTKENFRRAAEFVTLRFPSSAAETVKQSTSRSSRSQSSQKNESILVEFTKDLTQKALNGDMDPIIGREDEISRIVQILSRRTKNNPVLIGESGVGKTAIVEGLAQRIANGSAPKSLLKKRILVLDLPAVVAGTKYRGDFEERMIRIVKEITEAKNIILFIDEFHTLVGSGSGEGSMDGSNLLKPALARGQLQCIGATTLKEYRKYVEKDPALERRFHKVIVQEPNDESTIAVLNGIKSKYEEFHKVHYDNDVIEAIVKYSRRYITDRFFPDKAIDILDDVGAMKKVQNQETGSDYQKLVNQIETLTEQKKECIKTQNFEEAAKLRDKVNSLRNSLDSFSYNEENPIATYKNTVTVSDVCAIISKITGIPLSQMNASETKRLATMEKALHKTVIGQDEAISIISSAVRRSRAGVSSTKRPQGSFIFLGPTGVGKTLLAKTIAKFLFGSEDSLIRLDMSDFMEKHTASRMVGAPPGYVGYEEGGFLTEKVRRNPYSIILLDEIEKAHPDIFNLLLQILEEGELKDNLGHTVNFRNTVIIMTSNAGARQINAENRLGFSNHNSGLLPYDELKTNATEELKKIMTPELLNRIDDVIVFTPLNQDEIKKILDLQIDELQNRLLEQGLRIKLKPAAKRYFVENGYEPTMGARPMRRLIQKQLEDKISLLILDGKTSQNDTILVDYKKEEIVLSLQTEEKTVSKKQLVLS